MLPTTSLSSHINFGQVSCREVYYYYKKNLGAEQGLVSWLYWRDFYMTVVQEFNKDYSKKSVTLPDR